MGENEKEKRGEERRKWVKGLRDGKKIGNER